MLFQRRKKSGRLPWRIWSNIAFSRSTQLAGALELMMVAINADPLTAPAGRAGIWHGVTTGSSRADSSDAVSRPEEFPARNRRTARLNASAISWREASDSNMAARRG